MGILIPILVGLAALGCYAPSLRDCTVSCEAPSDCAAGQVCGSDGLCASPEVAGSCGSRDAGRPSDAGIGTDRPETVPLRVQIGGRGSVIVDLQGTCSSEPPQDGDCVYDIALGLLQLVHALPIRLDERFLEWVKGPCIGQTAICTFTPTEATTIAAKFGKSGAPDD